MRHKACMSRNFRVKYPFPDVRYTSLTFSHKREETSMQLSAEGSSNRNGDTAITISNLNLQAGFVETEGTCSNSLKTHGSISAEVSYV